MTILIVFLICCIAYSPFIFGDKLFIYSDIGSDTLVSFVPGYLTTSEYIRTEGVPLWSFSYGLGDNMYVASPIIFDPFVAFLMLFGDNLIYALPWVQVIKILLISTFVYLWMKKLSHNPITCMVVAILFSFNAGVIVRGGWYQHANDSFLYPFMFFAFESFIQKNNRIVLPISGLLLVLMRSTSYPYVYTLILCGYCVVRFIMVYDWDFKVFLKKWFQTIGLFFLGIGIGSFHYLPTVIRVITSNRQAGLTWSFSLAIRDFHSLLTAGLSLLSPNIMDTGNSFLGVNNILEAPLIYCGLFTIFAIPYAIKKSAGKIRSVFLLLLGFCLLFMLFPSVHKLLSGPIPLYFKTTVIIIPIVLIFIASYGINYIIYDATTVKSRFLASFPCILILIINSLLVLNLNSSTKFLSIKATTTIVALLLLYAFILFYLQHPTKKRNTIGILIALLCAEVSFNSYTAINHGRHTLTKNDIEERNYYWDGTKEAVVSLETDSFYRVQKTYDGYSELNNSQVNNYNGTIYYNSFINRRVMDFLKQIDPVYILNQNVYLPYYSDFILGDFLSVRYIFDKGTNFRNFDYWPTEYQYNKTIGDIDVYENKYYLPFGFLYEQYMDLDDFANLDKTSKLNALHYAFISEKYSDASLSGFDKYMPTNMVLEGEPVSEITVENMDITSHNGNQYTLVSNHVDPKIHVSILENLHETKMLNVSFDLENNSNEIDGQIFWRSDEQGYKEEYSKHFPITFGNKPYNIEITSDFPISEFRLDFGQDTGNTFELSNMKISKKPSPLLIQKRVMELQKNALQITNMTSSTISGTISSDNDRMLFLSIPFDEGWHATVDGESSAIEPINIGFSGIRISSGNHDIKLWYMPPGLVLGILISIASLFVYIIIIFKGQKIMRKL